MRANIMKIRVSRVQTLGGNQIITLMSMQKIMEIIK